MKLLNFFKFLILFFTTFFSMVTLASPQDDIKALANSTTNNSLQILATQKSQIEANPQLLNNIIRQQIMPVVDINAMSKLALGGKNWRIASTRQRQQFTQGFKNMLIRTYSRALLEHIKSQTNLNYNFKVKRAWVDGQYGAAIGDLIRGNGSSNIRIKYDFRRVGNSWKVYNIHIQGIDYIKSFRNSFQREVRTSGLDNLIARLQRGENVGVNN